MLSIRKKIILTLLLLSVFSFFDSRVILAVDVPDYCQQTPIPDDKVNECVPILTNKGNELKTQANSYLSQIAVMNSQIRLTEARIQSNKKQISDLTLDIDTAGKKIVNLEKALEGLTKVLLNRIVATYEVGTIKPFQILITSTDASSFVSRLNYLKIAQSHDKELIFETQQAKNDYTNQKTILETQKKRIELLKNQLQAYSKNLDDQKAVKQRFLAETQGSEATYQSLLSQAQAQLAAFSGFVASRGGASILNNQTVCDDGWSGCYYNQRDTQWGNNSLNGTQYTLASDGCLVTAMAMVYTNLGKRGVTPQTINSNPSNFASYFPAYLNKTISAEGMTTSRIYATIDAELSAGKPVIIGIGAGPDHFIVFISGSNGNYKMNDPFVPNGHNINFTDHYSISNINSIERISY